MWCANTQMLVYVTTFPTLLSPHGEDDGRLTKTLVEMDPQLAQSVYISDFIWCGLENR